jgi:hypothetical protein
MKCPHCGNPAKPGDDYCLKCGGDFKLELKKAWGKELSFKTMSWRDVAVVPFILLLFGGSLFIINVSLGPFPVISFIISFLIVGAILVIIFRIKKLLIYRRYSKLSLSQLQDPNLIPKWNKQISSDTIYGSKTEAWFENLARMTFKSENFAQDVVVLQKYYIQLLSELKTAMEFHWKFTEELLAKESINLFDYANLNDTVTWLNKIASTYYYSATCSLKNP